MDIPRQKKGKRARRLRYAVFAFDAGERLRLVNRAGVRLLAQPAARLLGRRAADLGLRECLNVGGGDERRTLQLSFPAAARAAGASPAASSGSTARRTGCSCSQTSAARCARRSRRRGSASCACSDTS